MPSTVAIGGVQQQSFQLSQEQLAEFIKSAESMPMLKSKVAPVRLVVECQHPAVRLQRGGNQFAAWITCQDCHARWKAPGHLRPGESKKKKKEETSSASSSAQDKFDKEKLSLELKNKYSEMMLQQRATLMLEVEQKRYAEEQMIKGLRQEAGQRELALREMRMDMMTARSREEMQNAMMDEFATRCGPMQRGSWPSRKEMKELEAQVEACNRTQEEMRENVSAAASARSLGSRKVRRDEKSKSPSARARRHGSS